MKRSISIMNMVLLGVVLALALPAQANAQEKKAGAAPKEVQLNGRIQMINKETSTITLKVDNVDRYVVYNEQTKYTIRNQPGSAKDVKEGVRVICKGKLDEKGRLAATRIDVRD